MTSTQPTTVTRGHTRLPHAPSKTSAPSSHRSSSAGKIAGSTPTGKATQPRVNSNTNTRIAGSAPTGKAAQPRVNSNTRMPSGEGRKTNVDSRGQMNNNNKTTGASRPVQSNSAGRVKSTNSKQDRGAVNGSAGHRDRYQNSADKSKRKGSGSFRHASSRSKADDGNHFSSPELQTEGDEDDSIKFIDVPRDGSLGSKKDQAKLGTICPKTILEESQEKQINKVYEIDLHASKITKIHNLEKFTCLRVLDLSSNHIRRIENLDSNKEIKELKLYDNDITEICNLDSTRELCTLQLQHNRIKQIGKGLSCLRKLSVLRLDSNKLSKIDSREMAPCGQLTYLDISSNTLDNLAPLNCLSSLEELHATHNLLTSIADLSRCRKLQEVDVSFNQITDIAGLKNLPHLIVLNVSHNRINTSCLKAMGKLKSLQTLDISHNKLTDLGSIAMQFLSLEVLNVTHNNVSKWSTMCSLSKCENLSELFASSNPFCEDDGEKPNYHNELQTIISSLEIIDGANVKKNTPRSAPVMRPQSATTIISAKQVENQLKTVEQQLAQFGADLTARFESARSAVDSLPSEAPSPRPLSHLSIRSFSTIADSRPGTATESRPGTAGSSRPSSRCGSRRRIADAQAYAAEYGI